MRGLVLSWWKTSPFRLTNSRCFSSIAAFNESSLECLNSKFIFLKELIMHNVLSIPQDTQHLLLPIQTGFSFSPGTFLLYIFVKNSFYITFDHSSQKRFFFAAFEQRITDGNAIHYFFSINCEAPKHHSSPIVKVFSNVLQYSCKICEVFFWYPISCDLDYF